MRCAVVEYNWYHDLVIPTFVYALNELGFDVDVYQPREALATDALCYAGELRYQTYAIDGFLGRLRGTPRRNRRYDLTIANSIEPVEVLRRTAGLSGPLLSVLHNAFLLDEPEYAAYFEPPRRAPIVLSGHIANLLRPEWKSNWIAPVHFGEVPRRLERSEGVDFCVQGGFAFDRRNYDSLLAASEQLLGAGQAGFRVTFVGSSDTPDGLAYRARLARSPASAIMEFTAPRIPYRDFYSMLAGADFMLPLIDTSTAMYEHYYVDKASTSLMMSIGLGVVPILHSRLSQLYGLSDAGISYEDGGLADAMSRGLALRSEEATRLRQHLLGRREALLAETVANLRRAIDAVS